MPQTRRSWCLGFFGPLQAVGLVFSYSEVACHVEPCPVPLIFDGGRGDVEPPWIDRPFYRPGVSDELGHFLVYRVVSSSPGPPSSSGSIAQLNMARS